MIRKKEIGKWGEEKAKDYLIQKNYRILEIGYRFKRAEVDIIAQFNSIIIFVEVKTRSRLDFGRPEDFVSEKKQKLMIDAANDYMIKHENEGEIRFDIISILKQDDKAIIEHFEDAFFPNWGF